MIVNKFLAQESLPVSLRMSVVDAGEVKLEIRPEKSNAKTPVMSSVCEKLSAT